MSNELDNPPVQRVLVVDDCEHIRALVKVRLRNDLVALHFACGGAEGLAACRKLLPDLVLLDWDMPDMSGPEVLKRLKADATTLQIPVIMLTGEMATEAKVSAFDMGAADYITKPFDATELRARVRAALRTKYLLDLLSQKAMIDGLTGLWNRAFFNERLPSEIALSRRTANPLSLLMVDLDHFKSINDRHGHPFGDEVLKTVARALQSRVRVSDVVCRYGGEEFSVILPNTDAPRAQTLAENLRELISDLRFVRGRETLAITASFGVSDLAAEQDALSLLQVADGALYHAKRRGRNCVEFASALTGPLLETPRTVSAYPYHAA